MESLLDPQAFGHPAQATELLETHISWVVLAGDYAYKIKKPLKLDFLDFGDLEKRRFYCEEEVRLNQPWAPDIYLDVVPIVKSGDLVRVDGVGEPVEYAVRMRRFDQSARLDKQLAAGKLTVEDMKLLGASIAERHLAAEAVPATRRGRVLALTKDFMFDNFEAVSDTLDFEHYADLKAWTATELDAVKLRLAARFDDGFVRSCHGDLHLGNLVRLDDRITTYDCIDFNVDLRHIDVMCDAAFLVMDLMARGSRDLASHFLNRYLEVTGDYDGVAVFNLFFVYRCMVRAKVAVIRSTERNTAKERRVDIDEAIFYCELGRRQIADRRPVLVLMHGVSGAGKTRVSAGVMAALPAIRIRSDLERKRMSGLTETEDSHSGVGTGIYADDVSTQVYARLHECAASMLQAGHNVIVDAANLKKWQRSNAVETAEKSGSDIILVDVRAPQETLRERLIARAADRSEASEAGVRVLEHQLATREPIQASESFEVIDCDASEQVDTAALVSRIRAARWSS